LKGAEGKPTHYIPWKKPIEKKLISYLRQGSPEGSEIYLK
jgi:hypothetical protein